MKIVETALSAAVLMLASANASRHAEEPHHDWKGTTRGICSWNVEKVRDDSRSSGWVELEQPKEGTSHLSAYMGYLEYNKETGEGAEYSMELRDDDKESCEGTLLTTLGTFKASAKRRGKLLVDDIH